MDKHVNVKLSQQQAGLEKINLDRTQDVVDSNRERAAEK